MSATKEMFIQMQEEAQVDADYLDFVYQMEQKEQIVDEHTNCSTFTFKGKIYNFVSRMGMLITGECDGEEFKANEMAQGFSWNIKK